MTPKREPDAAESQAQEREALATDCCEARNTWVSDERGGPDVDEHYADYLIAAGWTRRPSGAGEAAVRNAAEELMSAFRAKYRRARGGIHESAPLREGFTALTAALASTQRKEG